MSRIPLTVGSILLLAMCASEPPPEPRGNVIFQVCFPDTSTDHWLRFRSHVMTSGVYSNAGTPLSGITPSGTPVFEGYARLEAYNQIIVIDNIYDLETKFDLTEDGDSFTEEMFVFWPASSYQALDMDWSEWRSAVYWRPDNIGIHQIRFVSFDDPPELPEYSPLARFRVMPFDEYLAQRRRPDDDSDFKLVPECILEKDDG